MAAKLLPPQDVLNRLLSYDPATGDLRWRERGEEWLRETSLQWLVIALSALFPVWVPSATRQRLFSIRTPIVAAYRGSCLPRKIVDIRSATGTRNEAIYYEWAPLEQMSEKERADIFKTKSDAARALIGSSSGQEIITREALSDALVNTFTEDGSLPGLDGFIDEYGKLSEQGPSEAEIIAAATPTKNN